MIALNVLAVFCTAALGSAIPRDSHYVPKGACCFSLHDASNGKSVRQQTSSGFLYVGGSQTDGWYCLNLADHNDILRDRFNNACFEQEGDFKFKCFDPSPGKAKWTLSGSKGNVMVAHDGDTGFKACHDNSGAELLYTDNASKSGCRAVKLAAGGLKGTCGKFV